jgi:hypothetical protein
MTKRPPSNQFDKYFFNSYFNLIFVLDLSEAIDVYNAWIDACEEANKSQPIVT